LIALVSPPSAVIFETTSSAFGAIDVHVILKAFVYDLVKEVQIKVIADESRKGLKDGCCPAVLTGWQGPPAAATAQRIDVAAAETGRVKDSVDVRSPD
jgi:hypothetical protein